MIETKSAPSSARFPSEKLMVELRNSIDALIRDAKQFGKPVWINDEDGAARWTKADFDHLAHRVWNVRGFLSCIWGERFRRTPVPTGLEGWPDEEAVDSAITTIGDAIHRIYWAWRITGNLEPVPYRGMYQDYKEEDFIEPGRPIPEIDDTDREALTLASDKLDRAILSIAGPPRRRHHSDR